MHALLARQGIPREQSDLFGKGGREFLAAPPLPEGSRRRLDSLMALIGDFDRELAATTREIDARAKTDERVNVLCQIGRDRPPDPHALLLRAARRRDPLPDQDRQRPR